MAWLGTGPPDDARLLTGSRPEVDALIASAAPPRAGLDLTPLWREHGREIVELLGDALTGSVDERREALAAVDGAGDGIALGAIVPDGSLGPETAVAVRELLLPLADRLAALLDDTDPEVQAGALRVLAKLGDERVTPARIATAAADGAPVLAAAAVFAAERLSRDRPGAGTGIALAVAPLLGDERWPCRLTAVEMAVAVGPPGAATLERAGADRHPVVRAAALSAHRRLTTRLDLPTPPSKMP